MAKVGTVVIEIDANTAKLVQGIKKSNNQISKMQKSVNRAKSSMANFAKAVIGIYAVEKAFSSAAKAATAFIKTAAQFEQYETTLRSITGSSEQAEKSMDWISDFTAKTPFKLAQVTEAFVKMKAYGLDPTDGTLKTLGNTASAMGKDINQAVEAMADAVTGENERLKEFGIKASKQGEKVAYAWSDSSGKSRNIVIKNNKDMIESTLNAIFNEKYIGAMEAQSNTWNGIVSNMSDKWTMFKRDVMSEGLFVYFKSLARVISSYMSAAFGDAKSSAKGFSDGAIEYVNGIIRAMGFLKDVISGMSLAFKAIEYAVLFMSKAVMQALNAPMQAINYLIDRYNALGDVLGYQKASMKAPTIDTTWTDSTMAQLKKEMSSIVDDLANDSGQKLAEKVIGKTKEGIAGVTSELDKLSSKKDEYRDTLDLIGAGYGGLSTSSKKAAKGADTLYKKYLELTGQKDKLFQFDVDKTMKEFIKSGKYSAGQLSKIYDAMWEKYKKSGEDANKGIVSTIQEAVSSIANAYRDGGMAAVGDQIGDMVVNGLNSVMSGLGTALEAVGALFSSQVTQAEIDASVGQVEFNDDSLKNLEAVFENAQYPMLEVTNKMYKHIRNMDANFYSIARAMSSQASSGGIDLTGVNFVDTFESGFLGFSSKSISLIGTGLKFELQNLSELMDEATLSVHSYTTKLVKKSSWWGLKKSSKIRETYKDLPTSVRDDIAKSFANGFESILTAGVTLGLGKIDLKQLLLDSEVDLGKIDFTELSPSEVSDRLSQVFSEAFSGVIAGIDGLDALTDRYAKNSEYALETLSRIAVQYDQAAHMFMLIGKKFEDGGIVQVAKQFENIRPVVEEELDWWQRLRSGDWGSFDNSNFSGDSWLSGIFGKTKEAGETWEQFITKMVDTTYTAQMQILDIVDSTGGLTEFQDAMGAFMSGFYTDSEQLGFLTKSMEASFETLGIEMPKTNAEFRRLLETMDTSTEEGAYLYGQVLLLADSFNAMTDASEDLGTSMKDMIQGVSDAWLGNLSYLSLQQKAEYASGLLRSGLSDEAGAINTVDAAKKAAEIALRTTSTKEEYIPVFERYISELENEVEDASRTDLLNELRELKSEVVELRTATIDAYIHTGATA